MTEMTNREMIRKIQTHKGKVQAGVLVTGDIAYIFVEKADLVRYLKQGEPDAISSLQPVGEVEDGILTVSNGDS